MSILLSSISALEFWRFATHVQRVPRSAQRILKESFAKASFQEIMVLGERGFSFLTDPIHVLVPNSASRCRGRGVVSHVASGEEFYRAVVPIVSGVYVVSPHTCLLSLANTLSYPNLVEVGFELCGRYARSVGGFDGIAQRDPLMSVTQLERFLTCVGSVSGARVLRQARRFILDGSMSPMETVTVILLCFPLRLGGYGLPLPVMNAVINVPAKDRPYVKKSYYKCDLYWPEAQFALEYDSNLHHTGATRIAEDASRRADLAYLGIEVATLTQQQAYDRRETARIARLLAKRLGKRLRAERFDVAAQNDLRQRLLG